MRRQEARSAGALVALVAFVALVACAGDAGGCSAILGFEDTALRNAVDSGSTEGGGPGDEAGPSPDSGASHLTVKPTSLVVRRGAGVDLAVDLARGSDVTGAVTLKLAALPPGVTAPDATLAQGATTAVVHLTAATTATLGSTNITLTADGTPLAPVSIPLLVADLPGALDVTFDSDGLVSDASRGVGATFLAVGVQTDGKVVAAGGAAASAGAALNGWVIRRYAPNGVPDTAFNTLTSAAGVSPVEGQVQAFGGTGVVRIAPEAPATASFGFGVAVQPDGAIVVVGSRRDLAGTTDTGILTRFLENGARDTTFNGGTTVAVAGTQFVGVAADGDGFLIGGSTIGGALPSYFATRRSGQGVLDSTFGTGGTAAFGNTFRANAFARLADGSIALVGDVPTAMAGYTAGVATPKGAAVFARGYGNATGAGFFGIAVQADGNIVAAGHTAVTNGEARVERILPGGDKDATFGTAGVATIEAAGTANGIDVTLFATAVQPDGRIVVAGNRTNAGAVLYRLWP
jgi:uncharacterized delta-60 repeat protein